MDVQAIDRLCDEFERRVRADSRLRVEEYLSKVGDCDCDDLIVELLLVESELVGDHSAPRFQMASDPLLRQFKEALVRGTEPNVQEYVDRVSVPGDALRVKVALLRLKRDLDASSRQDLPTLGVGDTPEPTPDLDPSHATRNGMPDCIGHYKVLQLIGEGGMGTVFMAEQQEPVRRRVALKIIKPGMDSQQVIARFDAERQALAMMDHPNIARVLDAGATDRGHPFFVMELVKGIPITRYCDTNRLTIAERLELFVPLCHAIQHAHQKGIIHRDIKPSNVLVSNNDGQPIPKVIDFGVAKAVEQRLTDKTVFTQLGQVIGTLEYMSPEQAGLSQLDVDTRSDVYSLGVLLYELLTGSTPLTKQRLRRAGFDETMRLIREAEPQKPSTRLDESGDAVSSISADRRTDPKKLRGLIRGDLDWIVMKSLEKDRTRRYETAISLAHDICRYLSGDVVEARPPSSWYRLAKIARKNRVAVLTVSCFLGMLLYAVLMTFSHSLRAAQHQRDIENFGKLLTFVDHMMDEVSEVALAHTPHAEPTRKAVLENAAGLHGELLELSPSDDSLRVKFARSQQRLGDIYELTGDHDQSRRAYQEAIGTLEMLKDKYPDDLSIQFDLGVCHNDLAEVFRATNSATEAEHHYRAAIDMQLTLHRTNPDDGEFQRELYRTRNNLGFLLTNVGRFQESEEVLNSGVRDLNLLTSQLPPKSELTPISLADLARMNINLGRCMRQQHGRESEAEDCYRDAIKILEPLATTFPQNREHRHKLGIAMLNLGNLLLTPVEGQPDRENALQWYIKANDQLRELRTNFPGIPLYRYELANSHNSLTNACFQLGNMTEAKENLEFARLELQQLAEDFPEYTKHVADCPHLTGIIYGGLGGVALEVDQDAESADRLIAKAIEHQKRAFDASPANPNYRSKLIGHYRFRADILDRLGRDEEAAEMRLAADELKGTSHPIGEDKSNGKVSTQ